MAEPSFQCVPNFSEGRRSEIIAGIADAIRSVTGVRLIDYSADRDHNRCVMTLLGSAEPLFEAMLCATRYALQHIDLRSHRGIHPRSGAVDVLPIVPLGRATRKDAVALAQRIGTALAQEFALPVYFYEWASQPGRPSALPLLRKGGFEALIDLPLLGDRAPDIGPAKAHPTAGIAIVGARPPLVAYNINLFSSDVEKAKQIAKQIRRERNTRPELEGVRALGLFLDSQNRAQVSMNLTCPNKTPLPSLFDTVQEFASALGVAVAESEIIGAIPLASLGGKPPSVIRWHSYRPSQILETWLPDETP